MSTGNRPCWKKKHLPTVSLRCELLVSGMITTLKTVYRGHSMPPRSFNATQVIKCHPVFWGGIKVDANRVGTFVEKIPAKMMAHEVWVGSIMTLWKLFWQTRKQVLDESWMIRILRIILYKNQKKWYSIQTCTLPVTSIAFKYKAIPKWNNCIPTIQFQVLLLLVSGRVKFYFFFGRLFYAQNQRRT